jgi:xylan 1,4-beta-xylosidase
MMRTRLAFAVVLALGAVQHVAWAQTPATVTITVDDTAPGAPIERIWPFHGFDEVNYTTTPQGKALLGALGTIHTAPVHIRSHFLLNTGDGTPSLKWGSTNVYTEDANGNPIYSWTLMDGIMDTVTGAGAFPYAEIAFMPQALTSSNLPYMNSGVYNLDGSCFYPPKDFTKWGGLIGAWAAHVKGRYANVESTWQWELWNEPDIGYWHGTAADYNKLYDYTESALHQALPNAPLGGPATAGTGTFFTQFLQHTATGANAVSGRNGTRLDFISFHAKGGSAIVGGHVEMNLGNQLRLHQAGFMAVASMAAYKQTPIVVSEADPDGCAACPVAMNHPEDAYRNSPAYGAYEVAMMKKTLELEQRLGVNVRGLLTWAFLFNDTPYFAGYRALVTNGIDLPVLNAFKLLGSLNGARLPVTSTGAQTLDAILASSVRQNADVDAMATRNGANVQVLVWNYHDDLVTVTATPVALTVKLPADFGARATVTHTRVDDTHGDAYTVWVAQGSPGTPTATQVAALQAAMQPAPLQPTQTVDVTNGAVALNFDLPREGISLITLAPPGGSPGTDAAAGGAGGTAADASVSSGNGGSSGGSGAAAGAGGAGTGAGGAGATSGIEVGTGKRSGCACGVTGSGGIGWTAGVVVVIAGVLVSRARTKRRTRTKTG